MNLEPLYHQLVLLNSNIETLIGAIAATGGVQATRPVAPTHNAATSANAVAASAANNSTAGTPGRPKTRYFRLENDEVVKSSSKDAPAGGVEITKEEYDTLNNAAAKVATKPAVVPVPTPAAPAASPFDDETPAEVSFDDVRTAAYKLRDQKGVEVAKAVIEKFAPKLPEVKPEQYAKLKAALESALTEEL